jgi:hypothetical protein
MGIDIVFWKPCSLQRALGVEQFLDTMKLTSYKAAAEQMAPHRLAQLKIRVQRTSLAEQDDTPAEEAATLTYAEVCARLDAAGKAAPDCASCLESGGHERGSYHYISYPIDEVLESLLFDYFVEQTPVWGSACNQIYRDIISALPSTGLAWHTGRGEDELALLPEPLVHRFVPPVDGHDHLDSAQVLAAVFRTLDSVAEVMAYGVLWNEFAAFVARQELAPDEASSSLHEALALGELFQLAAAHALPGGCEVLVYP